MKQLCDLEIHLEGGNSLPRDLGEVIKGELVVMPKVDIPASLVGYDLIGEVRGQIANKTTGIINKTSAWNTMLKAGEIYRYPIEFKNVKYQSYTGINANISIKLEAYVKVDRMKARAMKGAIKEFYGTFEFKEKKIKQELLLSFTTLNHEYVVETEELKLQIKSYLSTIIAFVFFGIFLVFLTKKLLIITILLVSILSALVFIYYLIGVLTIGKIKAKLEGTDAKSFRYKFENTRNWVGVKKLSAKYEIHEKVVDNRGTSSNTLDSIRFHSKKTIFEKPIENAVVPFEFPEDFPGTCSISDAEQLNEVSIYWLLKLEIEIFWKLGFTFKEEIIVNKKRSLTL